MTTKATATTTIPDEPRLTLSQAARILGLHHSTTFKLVKTGQLRAVKVGRNWGTYRSWVNEYLLARQNVGDQGDRPQQTIVIPNDDAAIAEVLSRNGIAFAD